MTIASRVTASLNCECSLQVILALINTEVKMPLLGGVRLDRRIMALCGCWAITSYLRFYFYLFIYVFFFFWGGGLGDTSNYHKFTSFRLLLL